jgi:hypothetical protein
MEGGETNMAPKKTATKAKVKRTKSAAPKTVSKKTARKAAKH